MLKCTTLGYGSNTARQKLEQSVEIDTDLTEEAAIDLTILCLWKACKSSSFDLVVVKSSGEIEVSRISFVLSLASSNEKFSSLSLTNTEDRP